jgi:hypothetical protein
LGDNRVAQGILQRPCTECEASAALPAAEGEEDIHMEGTHEVTLVLVRDEGNLEEFDAAVEVINKQWQQLRWVSLPLIVRSGPHISSMTTYICIDDGTSFDPYAPHYLVTTLRERFVKMAERLLGPHEVVHLKLTEPMHTVEMRAQHKEPRDDGKGHAASGGSGGLELSRGGCD